MDQLECLPQPLEAHEKKITKIVFSLDDKTCVSGDNYGNVIKWNMTGTRYPLGVNIITGEVYKEINITDKPTNIKIIKNKLILEGSTEQTLFFPRDITAYTVSDDKSTLMVASHTLLYCFKKNYKEDKYLLQWDEGDTLVCEDAKCEGVIGLSDNNKSVFRQRKALISSRLVMDELSFPQLSLNETVTKFKLELDEIKQEEQKREEKLVTIKQEVEKSLENMKQQIEKDFGMIKEQIKEELETIKQQKTRLNNLSALSNVIRQSIIVPEVKEKKT